MASEPKKTEPGAAGDAASAQAAILGVPLAAIAVISLVQKVFKIGLTPVLRDFIGVWRQLTAPIHDVLFWLARSIGLPLPEWYLDAFILSYVLVVIYSRVVANTDEPPYWHAIAGIFWSVPLFGLIFIWIALLPALRQPTDDETRRLHQESVRIWRELLAIAGIVVVFYVANSKL
jgi:hypothetical protein